MYLLAASYVCISLLVLSLTSSGCIFQDFYPAVFSVPNGDCCGTLSVYCATSPTMDGRSLLSSSLLSSTDASCGVCETVDP